MLLCFGTDQELEALRCELAVSDEAQAEPSEAPSYALRPITVMRGSPLCGVTILDSGIREQFDCMVVGIEREGLRLRSPRSDLRLAAGDLLWIVGESGKLHKLERRFEPQAADA